MVGYDGKVEEIALESGDPAAAHVALIGSAFDGAFLHSIARGNDPFTAVRHANTFANRKGQNGNGIRALPTAADFT
jgi:hypothetical protein